MVERSEEFEDTPTGWAKRWQVEFAASKKFLKPFWKQTEKVFQRYLDERKAGASPEDQIGDFTSRLNLFHSNIDTVMSMLYGRIPKVDVDRRYADQDDDIARVASVMLQRILNTDIETAGEDYSYVLRSSLADFLIGGLGTARMKYDFKEVKEEVPPQIDPQTGEILADGYTDTKIEDEWADPIYLHWRDVMWSPCRTWKECRWRAYRAYMSREELVARFGDIGKRVPLNSKGAYFDSEKTGKQVKEEIWDQAEVWEIWDKQNKLVWWYVDGFDSVLDKKKDLLELEGFWPEPPPMIANLTTNKYLPKADFLIAQDLYNEIDVLETRITLLTEACKCVGVYEKGNDGVQRLLMEGVENQLIPVDNWAAFAEKGGMKGATDWLPIEQVASVVQILTEKQTEKINLLYQVTGMSDILRGASDPRTSATAESAKAKFASIRMQALQDEFARFASDLMRIKAEIISKHYQPYCILQQSNIQMTPDAQYAEQAVQLIKDPKVARWRIVVKPESLAMVDYAQLQNDRVAYITALSQFMQSAAPLMEQSQGVVGPLMELLKWGLAGFKGSNEIEGVLDRAISDFEKQKQMGGNQKPDPEQIKAQAEMQRTQLEMQKAEMEAQARLQQIQAEMQQQAQEHEFKMQELTAKHQMEMAKIQAQMVSDRNRETAQAEGAVTQSVVDAASKVEVNKSAPKPNGAGKNA